MKILINTIPLLKPVTGVGCYIDNLCSQFLGLSSEDVTFYYGWFSWKLYTKFIQQIFKK